MCGVSPQLSVDRKCSTLNEGIYEKTILNIEIIHLTALHIGICKNRMVSIADTTIANRGRICELVIANTSKTLLWSQRDNIECKKVFKCITTNITSYILYCLQKCKHNMLNLNTALHNSKLLVYHWLLFDPQSR